MESLGIKVIDAQNWLEPDPVYRGYYGLLKALSVEDKTLERWLKPILAPALNEHVPREIRCLFETARSALVYGYFHYPLCTLASQQLYRVLETSVTLSCRTLEAPSKTNTFRLKIDWLVREGILPDEKRFWDDIRFLRNESSHPDFQTIFPEHYAVHTLEMVAKRVNDLVYTVTERKNHQTSLREHDMSAPERRDEGS